MNEPKLYHETGFILNIYIYIYIVIVLVCEDSLQTISHLNHESYVNFLHFFKVDIAL